MTVQASCSEPGALEYIREQEQKLADMFAYVPRKLATLADQLLREIGRLEALLPRYHAAEVREVRHARALLDSAIQTHLDNNEGSMAELLRVMRAVNL